MRSLTCSEIANDPLRVSRLNFLYNRLDEGTTPATVLLPWLPTPAMIAKLWATKEIYDIVTSAIRQREESGLEHNDALQMLLENKDEKLVVVGVGTLVSPIDVFSHVNSSSWVCSSRALELLGPLVCFSFGSIWQRTDH